MSAAKNLRAIDEHTFGLIGRPSISPCNQSDTNRILAHIFSFFGVTLVVTQQVIEKSGLPKRPFFRSSGALLKLRISNRSSIARA
ncbi:MAG: hypothetical protein DMF44_05705 [Verrucomicrobia bacterium]|nr:MAG: hypothetical protein DMF44_05705 [Verrucomicrobiota bacterium]